MRWISCQIGAREHYAVARALHRRRALELLTTDVWVRPGSPLGALGADLRARFHPDLRSAEVFASNAGSIAFTLRSKVSGLGGWPRILARNEWFQREVVRRLTQLDRGERVVAAYSYAALDILKFARERGWRTVLGQIDPGPAEDRIVAQLYERSSNYRGQFERPPARYWSSWREECELADRVVVNSSWSQTALIEEGVVADKIRIIPVAYEKSQLAAPFERAYPGAFSSSRPLHVLFLGQINLRKGMEPVLEAIGMLDAEPIAFTFVGPVQFTIPNELRNHPKVRWIGHVPRGRTEHFYREADVFLFPTFSDGFGMTQLEAQAWKLPVIASKFCGDVVIDGQNGCVLPEVTADAIATVLRRCCAEPAWLQRMSDRSAVDKRLDLDSIGEQWLRVFD
jgi:glycosyltransferase involved in cell wall biosynthesis